MNRTIIILGALTLVLSGCETSSESHSPVGKAAAHQAARSSQSEVSEATHAELLQGKWQSVDDKTNFLVFEKNHRKEIAGGMDHWDDEVFVLADRCANSANKDSSLEKEKDRCISCAKSGMCWRIVGLNSSKLSLSYMGRGNTLNYRKVK